jgi:hypothetical protein
VASLNLPHSVSGGGQLLDRRGSTFNAKPGEGPRRSQRHHGHLLLLTRVGAPISQTTRRNPPCWGGIAAARAS